MIFICESYIVLYSSKGQQPDVNINIMTSVLDGVDCKTTNRYAPLIKKLTKTHKKNVLLENVSEQHKTFAEASR